MSFLKKYFVTILIFFLLVLLTACTAGPTPAQNEGNEPALEHKTEENEAVEHGADPNQDDQEADEHEHDEGEDNQEVKRVPNNGAVVKIVAPENGAEIEVGTDVVVEIETENFELDKEGNHWHLFVDGQSQGTSVGRDFNQVVRGLEPDEHEISVTLSIGTHEELEEGDAIEITVVE